METVDKVDRPDEEPTPHAGGTRAGSGGCRADEARGALQRQYEAARTAAVLTAPQNRGLIEVSGADRAAWLNNLVTNEVRDLAPGRGVGAYALNAKGRILLEATVLARQDAFWLDVDSRRLDQAIRHLSRYVITERVELRDLSGGFARIGLLGPRATAVLAEAGMADAANLTVPGWSAAECPAGPVVLVRRDGPAAESFELLVEPSSAELFRHTLLEAGRAHGLIPAAPEALEVLRVEQGLPAWGQDIDENTLPAETGRMQQMVSFTKGCYLGQEIVERMRSRGGPARLLVGLRFTGAQPVSPGVPLVSGDQPVGRVTGAVLSWRLGGPVGLGLVKTACAVPGIRLSVSAPGVGEAEVVALPMVGS